MPTEAAAPPHPPPPPAPPLSGRPAGRPGVGAIDVQRAADALLRAGERPTLERVRARIGRGSPNTIQPLLDQWWKTIGARLDAGPTALHRLPESVLHIVEALWLQCVEEARKRAAIELETKATHAADTEQKLEVRSYVLTLREGELDRRLRERDAAATGLETQVAALSTLLQKEQAARAHDAAQRATLEREISETREQLATALLRANAASRTQRVTKPTRGTHAKPRREADPAPPRERPIATGRSTELRSKRRQTRRPSAVRPKPKRTPPLRTLTTSRRRRPIRSR